MSFEALNLKSVFFRIRSDHNSDDTIEILKKCVNSVKTQYHRIETEFEEYDESYDDENGPAHWTTSRFLHVIRLRESALNFARFIWADYFFVSTDLSIFNYLEQTFCRILTVMYF